jgi:hypothetical protein
MNIYCIFKMYFKCLEKQNYKSDYGVSAIMLVTFRVLGKQSEYI